MSISNAVFIWGFYTRTYCWSGWVHFHHINGILAVVNMSPSLTKWLLESKWSPLQLTRGFMISFKSLAFKRVMFPISSVFMLVKYWLLLLKWTSDHDKNATISPSEITPKVPQIKTLILNDCRTADNHSGNLKDLCRHRTREIWITWSESLHLLSCLDQCDPKVKPFCV